MMPGSHSPSLYEMLLGNFAGGLELHQVSEENQVVLSVLDNMQRILNCRAGTLSHLPDYGLPDMSKFPVDHPLRHVAEIRTAPKKSERGAVASIHARSSGIRHRRRTERGGTGALWHRVYA
jgi:predicted component of type VI protein secretion system